MMMLHFHGPEKRQLLPWLPVHEFRNHCQSITVATIQFLDRYSAGSSHLDRLTCKFECEPDQPDSFRAAPHFEPSLIFDARRSPKGCDGLWRRP